MFAAIRQTFPSTRTMTDARLTAVVAATVLLLVTLADAGAMTTAGIAAGAVAVIVLMRRAKASEGDRAAAGLHSSETAVFAAPRPARAEAPSAPAAPADDVLLARAIALRDRVSVRR